jgi:RimJ/RimL family protein N-acetyltransferase
MNTNPFTGKLVRLATFDLETHPQVVARWDWNSEYTRLLNDDVATLATPKQIKEWIEKEEEENHFFMIHSIEPDQPVGVVSLNRFNWTAGDCWVGIGLGVSEIWGKGYGYEALNLILGYAFRQLNLRRVSLNVFEYNPRAIRCYEKCGFQHEGRARSAMNRDGRRWDILFMGCMRDEWEALQI